MNVKSKQYYSIGEVSEIVDLKEHVLRFWEKEFKELAPQKSSKNRRRYTDFDISVINRIKTLLYEEEFTISGAQRQLSEEMKHITRKVNEMRNTLSPPPQASMNKTPKLPDYKVIVTELKEILQLLK